MLFFNFWNEVDLNRIIGLLLVSEVVFVPFVKEGKVILSRENSTEASST